MYMIILRKVLKVIERKKFEYYIKFNEKLLVGVKKGGDLIWFIIYFGCCLEKGLEWDKSGSWENS